MVNEEGTSKEDLTLTMVLDFFAVELFLAEATVDYLPLMSFTFGELYFTLLISLLSVLVEPDCAIFFLGVTGLTVSILFSFLPANRFVCSFRSG